MRFLFSRALLLALALSSVATALRANDFYPPLPAAKSSIDFDNRGFLIHGQRTFIASAGIEYARVPRALWRDRLLKIKRAGFNCVEIYTFWNYHEIKPGVFDFTGDKDVGAFLDLAHELGLYITVRVGPYVCAEWENGGFPMWLRFQPGMRTRGDDPTYLKFVDRWYNQILPVVASRQIERGGGVIMVQLENEHPEGWGAWDIGPYTDDEAYFKDLFDSARAHGIDVLTFFSGMNHGGDPAPQTPISSTGRPNPWYTTEYWSGWYSMYGPFPATGDNSLIHYDRAAWRFLENGAGGFNVYMFHGGTNFGTTNNNETAASYDYAGAIGQAGDLRPIYYKYKRVALFARSFQEILENCDDATPAHASDFPGLTVRARTGPAGTLVFLDNPGAAPVDAKFPDGNTMTLAPGEVTGLVRDFKLDDNFTLVSSEARILGIAQQGKRTVLVIHGPEGSTGKIEVTGSFSGSFFGGSWKLNAKGNEELSVTFGKEGTLYHLGDQPESLAVWAVSSELADKTFFLDGKSGTTIVTGAPYADDFTPDGDDVETPIDATMASALTILYPNVKNPAQLPPIALHPVDTTAPALANWQAAPADAEAAPNYDDSKWLAADEPPAMGADGDGSAYAWYRTTLHADAAGTQYLQVPYIGDQAIVFLNGARLPGTYKGLAQTIPLPLAAGANTLAILTSHNGRSKLFGTFGRIDRIERMGLTGPIRLSPTQTPFLAPEACAVRAFWKEHPTVEQLVDPKTDASGPDWSQTTFHSNFGYTPGTWRELFAVVRTTLPELPGPNRMLHVGVVDEKATFYLNGQKIGEQPNARAPQPGDILHFSAADTDLPLDAAWKEGGPNQLGVVLENVHRQATVGLVTLTSGPPGVVVTGWKMRGNLTDRTSPALAWTPAPASAPGVPTYYHTAFTLPADYYKNATPILRLSAKGMSRGFAWLNGHNLGRYPERVQVDGLYLPECWLTPGPNDLTLLDEEGNAIASEHLYVELPASRKIIRR
jgi:beta-galactosidase